MQESIGANECSRNVRNHKGEYFEKPIPIFGDKLLFFIIKLKIYLRIFGVTDYECGFIFLKWKIASPIWRNKNTNYPMLIKIGIQGLQWSLKIHP